MLKIRQNAHHKTSNIQIDHFADFRGIIIKDSRELLHPHVSRNYIKATSTNNHWAKMTYGVFMLAAVGHISK